MEVASIHFPFKTVELDGLLYRTPDRKIQSSSSCFVSGDLGEVNSLSLLSGRAFQPRAFATGLDFVSAHLYYFYRTIGQGGHVPH